ncbi:MAG TPA: DnaB-like helicase C-terminal domain-containing protein [Thermomicrobiales bacterium]|nr:DnaB-like helicase C-terminal domain-containing protein [Thermomicrobiales bacterium]
MSLDRGTCSDRGAAGTAPAALRSRAFIAASSSNRGPVEAVDEWTADTADGVAATRSLVSVSRDLDQYAEEFAQRLLPIPTGFDVLDHWIGNGLRQGELLLLGGAPGVGKTTFCLQIARNIAAGGHANVLYACYEHPEEYVLNRLLVQETIDPGAPLAAGGLTLEELQLLSAEIAMTNGGGGFYETLRDHPAGARATSAIDEYAGRFHLVANAARENGIRTLQALVAEHRARSDEPLVLFVDYLQKVEPAWGDVTDEDERVTEVVQALKQMALEHNVAIVAIAASDKSGIEAPRLRFRHLRGSSALLYEADIAVIMNDKWSIIDRDHIVFNQHKAQQYRDWVVCTVEKNRGGRNLVEIEFMKRFEYCCFNPRGGRVTERLYEERIQGES